MKHLIKIIVVWWGLGRVTRAYIDPNSGGMLFQILAVAFTAMSGAFFFFSRQIKTFFAGLRRKKREQAPTVVEVDPEMKTAPKDNDHLTI